MKDLKIIGLTFLGIILTSVAFNYWQTAGNLPSSASSVPKAKLVPEPAFDKSEETQARRKASIQELIRLGVFQKVEKPDRFPHVWVRPGFYALDYDVKTMMVQAVYAYYYDGTGSLEVVALLDSQTGKDVGGFDKYGLHLK